MTINSEEIQEIIDTSDRLIDATSTHFHRYLGQEIDWRDRLICIEGARGTGKTTLMRQRIKEAYGVNGKAVYISLDDLWFASHRVRDAVEYFYTHGYTHVFLDEVHHFGANWSVLIKNLYDQFPTLSFVYSGSSLLRLEAAKGDLSRRQAIYQLKGLSFREFLAFEGALAHDPLKFDDVLLDHRKIAAHIVSRVKILPLFERYLKAGYYPFYKESHALYSQRIEEVVNKVLESDWPAISEVSIETVRKAKRMLMVLAASVPQQPNMSKLYRELETERNTGLKMLNALDRGGLLALVPPKGESLKNLSRPEKIYCDNTNLMYALVPRIDIGTARETFFFNQVRKDHAVVFSGTGDFLVAGRWHFEIGGAHKGFDQIKDMPKSFVVNDGVELGLGNKIPLWLFGFLY